MNNWIKGGITGFVLSTSTVATAIETQYIPQTDTTELNQTVDAMDFAGGSKLKDRMIKSQEADKTIVMRILLDA